MGTDLQSFNQSALGGFIESPLGARGEEAAGDLYVGGSYNKIGGVTFNDIARWDRKLETWNPLGQGLSVGGQVIDLGDFDGKLVIVGTFSQIDTVPANNIALWDGSTMTTLGSGFNSLASHVFKWKGDLHICGQFTQADGNDVGGIAKWDTETLAWVDLDGGHQNSGGARIIEMDIDPLDGNLVVTGQFPHLGTGPQTPAIINIGKWNGTSWSKPVRLSPLQFFGADTGLASNYQGLLVNGSKVIGGSSGGPSRFDGSEWTTPFGLGITAGAIYKLTGFQNKLYCAGQNINSAGGNPANDIAFWNGSVWDDQGGGITIGAYIGSKLRVWDRKLVYTGSFTTISGVAAKRVAVYDPATNTFFALGSGIDDGSAFCAYEFKKL